jgi:hypothetical protein
MIKSLKPFDLPDPVGPEPLSGAEQALSARQRDPRLTIDTVPAPVRSTGDGGSVDFANQHYLDNVGLPLEQVAAGAGRRRFIRTISATLR